MQRQPVNFWSSVFFIVISSVFAGAGLTHVSAQEPPTTASVSASKSPKGPARIFSANPSVTPKTDEAKSLAASLAKRLGGSVTAKALSGRQKGNFNGLVQKSSKFTVEGDSGARYPVAGKVAIPLGDLFVVFTRTKEGALLGVIESKVRPVSATRADQDYKRSLEVLGFGVGGIVQAYQLAYWQKPSPAGVSATVARKPDMVTTGLAPDVVSKLLLPGAERSVFGGTASVAAGPGVGAVPAAAMLAMAATAAEPPPSSCGPGLTSCGKRTDGNESCCIAKSECSQDSDGQPACKSKAEDVDGDPLDNGCGWGTFKCGKGCCLAGYQCENNACSSGCKDGRVVCGKDDGSLMCCPKGQECVADSSQDPPTFSCKPPETGRCKEPQIACVSAGASPNDPFPKTSCCFPGAQCTTSSKGASCCPPGSKANDQGRCIPAIDCNNGQRCFSGQECCDKDDDTVHDVCVKLGTCREEIETPAVTPFSG